MKLQHSRFAACLFGFLVCLHVAAQGTFTLTNSNTSAVLDDLIFTNSLGTAELTNGTMIVFEGELQSDYTVAASAMNSTNLYVASVQLLTQIKLFDELPASSDVGNVQGAVAAWSNGTYFVWGITNAAPVAWVPLLQTNGVQFAVTEGETNYITFVFNYGLNGGGPNTYQVFIGKLGDTVMTPSEPVGSATIPGADQIVGVSLLGTGGLLEVGTASGSPVPLSTSIALSVYYASNSICADVYTANENGTLPIKIYAKINGEWVLVGTVDKVFGEGAHEYHIVLAGLTAGESYLFRIEDEAGHVHVLNTPLEVKAITLGNAFLETVAELQMQTLTVSFNTEQWKNYQVKVSEDVSAPPEQWTVEYVSPFKDLSWGAFTNVFQAGPGSQTTIRIPVNRNKAFFKVYMVE